MYEPNFFKAMYPRITFVGEAAENRMSEAWAHAEKLGILDGFKEQIKWLNDAFSRGTDGCDVGCDSAPLSFYFNIFTGFGGGKETVISGGLIYFGNGESGANAPQYSVSLSDKRGPRWEIHT